MATTPTPTPQPESQLPPAPQAQGDEDLTRLRGEVARQSRTIEELKSRLTAPPAPAAQTQPPSQQDLTREFYKDPVNSSAAIAQKIVQEALGQQTGPQRDTLIRIARDTARAKDPTLFDKYAVEIDAAVQTVQPQFHVNVNVWENAFKLVQGNHIDEIIADRVAKGQQASPAAEPPRAPAVHISSQGGPQAPSLRPTQAPKGEELTAQEKYTAKKLGLSEEQYKAGKKAYDGQNDPVTDPIGKSSWDEHITFSSRDKRRREAEARRAKK